MNTAFRIFLSISLFLCILQTDAEYEPYTQWGLPEGAKARLGKGGINDITYSHDGALLAVANQIGIWIYDIQTSEELALFTEHTGRINNVVFSPDGRILASGSHDRTVRLWDVAMRTEIGTLEGHTGYVSSVSFSPNGHTLASRGDDNTVRLWDVDTQTQIHTLEGYTGSVESVSFSPDGQTFASGGNDNIVRLWDIATRTEIGILEGHTGYVNSISFSPDGQTLASGGNRYGSGLFWRGGDMRLWDVATQTGIVIRESRSFSFTSISLSPDGQTIAYKTGSYSDYVGVWDINRQIRIYGYTLNDPEPTWDVFWILDAQVKKRGFSWFDTMLEGHTGYVSSVSFSPDGRTLASGGDGWSWRNNLVLWDVGTQTSIGGLNTSQVNSVVFSPDGRTLASGADGGIVSLWDVATQTAIGTHWEHIGAVNSVVFSPDGRTLASGSDDGTVLLWDIAEIEATSLLLGGFLTAKIDRGNDVDYFNVQIEEYGELTLWTTTTEPLDTIGTLQDSEGVTLATNADKNVDAAFNFRIEQYMYPGTYYIKVQSSEQMTGDYTIYAAFMPATDVNRDGVVSVIDLVLVAENFGISDATPAQGDVNGDGEVNREDIIAVLDALEAAAAAPAAVSTTESLQRWIDRAKQRNRTDARFQKGIAVLQNLLTTLIEKKTVPKATALLANYPNPFNPETWIPYQLANPADVTLKIYAADGKLVRLLILGHQDAGMYHSRNHAVYWDGRNVFGEPVASGLYFYTLTAGDFTATRKLLIRK